MNHDDKRALEKMISYCNDIDALMEAYQSDFEKYRTEIAFQYSCNMCIIQIGELVCRISDRLIDEHQEIPWYAIKGMRNLHAHDYENIDLEVVWTTLKEDIPVLREQIKGILREML